MKSRLSLVTAIITASTFITAPATLGNAPDPPTENQSPSIAFSTEVAGSNPFRAPRYDFFFQWIDPRTEAPLGTVIDDADDERDLTTLDVIRVSTTPESDCDDVELSENNENLALIVANCMSYTLERTVSLTFKAIDSDGNSSNELTLDFIGVADPTIYVAPFTDFFVFGQEDPILEIGINSGPYGFQESITALDFEIDTATVGLEVSRIERTEDAAFARVYFQGIVQELGTIHITAKGSAFVWTAEHEEDIPDSNQMSVMIQPYGFIDNFEIVTQPSGAISGQTFTTAAVLKLSDRYGNTVLTEDGEEVEASLATENGTLEGETATVVNGFATFTNLKIIGTGDFTITFNVGMASVTSETVTVSAPPNEDPGGGGSDCRIGFLDIDRRAEGAVNGFNFITQPRIEIQDSSGSRCATFNGEVIATISNENNQEIARDSVTASSGVATFTNLGLDIDSVYEGEDLTITYSAGSRSRQQDIYLAKVCDGVSIPCEYGDVGPGGGIVFYYDEEGFDCFGGIASCNYLEAARTVGTNAWEGTSPGPWSGNTDTAIGTTSREIGAGLSNSAKIDLQDESFGGVVEQIIDFQGSGGKYDWHIPSDDEMSELDYQSNLVGIIDNRDYWTSSESDGTRAYLFIGSLNDTRSRSKDSLAYVHPIRAFSKNVGSAFLFYSTFSYSPDSIPADGSSTSTISIQLRDVFGNNLSSGGAEVGFSLDPNLGSISATTDNGNGTYTAIYTAGTEAGSVNITPKLSGEDFIDIVRINLTESDADISPVVPGAPTIGTATALTATSAEVTYTAPTSDGGSTITSYRAISTPGNISATLSQAGSGTIIVSGLSPETSYTFRVIAVNNIGTSTDSAISNTIRTLVATESLPLQVATESLPLQRVDTSAPSKREEDKQRAKAAIIKKLQSLEKLTVSDFIDAGIDGITIFNIAEVQAELLALPAKSRGDIEAVMKIAYKFEVVDKIGSDQIRSVLPNVYIELGLIPLTSQNIKMTLISAVRKLPKSARDTYVKIKAVIDLEIKKIQARKDRISKVNARKTAKK